MSWICRLSKEAAKQFRSLPRDRQYQLGQAFQQMEKDPFKGDVRPVKSGKLQGSLRKRVGPYRIIFALDHSKNLIDIAAIFRK
ncbi:hypothetical protein LM602_05170 [Candidatus Acetothermia bacterium]|jgi:mRNA-degrading endonuclease RelE of RelBE toxin-antitoxin system|nr:hypothetical protein [Candidatus Acetothermia bacterium]MCI2431934.1 hypothetical protein [Candidatus Acetothermia bacterium]MCI2436615.1 hypothetical protein [Candidatus Acetothermia bacterium]